MFHHRPTVPAGPGSTRGSTRARWGRSAASLVTAAAVVATMAAMGGASAGAATASPSGRVPVPAGFTGGGPATGVVVAGNHAGPVADAATTPAASTECWNTLPDGATDQRGNLTQTCSSDVNGMISVVAQTAVFDDPRTSANWRSTNTGIAWAFSQTGVGAPQYEALLATPNLGGPVLTVVDVNDKLMCQVTPTFDVANRLYMGSFPATCIGSPPQYDWQTFMGYDYGTGVSNVGYVYAGPVVASGTAPPPAPGTVFSGFASIGCCTSGTPESASWAPGRVDTFIRGTDGALYHKWSVNGQWSSGWESLGGQITSAPAVVAPQVGRLEVFARGTDNSLYQKSYNNGWGPWVLVGGQLRAAPAVTSWGPGRLDVFVRGSDDALWHRWQVNGAWSGWERLGGTLTSAPAAVAWAIGRIDVVLAGANHGVWHIAYNSGWSGFDNLGGQIADDPGIASWGPGRLDVFVEGAQDHALYHQVYAGVWTGFVSLGGTLKSGPGASAWGPSHIDVLVQGTDNSVYHTQSG